MKLIYKTNFNYSHRIEDTGQLVDKECAVDHTHTGVELKVSVPVMNEFLDFKTIKEEVNAILGKYHNVNISNMFDLQDTESFVTELQREIQLALRRPVDLELSETPKYGISIASN